eukprot:TRINITY_DN638_c0_g2_i1.p1 TRINITY_DN638_c0_g2~~TRINITY_DN638_c0_g2_i1.p1  ORF type:complete len:285 (-),score=45.06 TRINITY_DN638_c0_g2_i1:1445-2299(-)
MIIGFFSVVNLVALVYVIVKWVLDKVYEDKIFDVSQALCVATIYGTFILCSILVSLNEDLDEYHWYPVRIFCLGIVFAVLSSGIMFGVYSLNADTEKWASLVYGILGSLAVVMSIVQPVYFSPPGKSSTIKYMCVQIAERVIHPSLICIVSFALYRNWSSLKDTSEDFYIWSGIIALNYILGGVYLSSYTRISSSDRHKKRKLRGNLLFALLALASMAIIAGILALYAFSLKSVAIAYLPTLTICGGIFNFLYVEERLPHNSQFLGLASMTIGFTVCCVFKCIR